VKVFGQGGVGSFDGVGGLELRDRPASWSIGLASR
jgi:hypothetical protein